MLFFPYAGKAAINYCDRSVLCKGTVQESRCWKDLQAVKKSHSKENKMQKGGRRNGLDAPDERENRQSGGRW